MEWYQLVDWINIVCGLNKNIIIPKVTGETFKIVQLLDPQFFAEERIKSTKNRIPQS